MKIYRNVSYSIINLLFILAPVLALERFFKCCSNLPNYFAQTNLVGKRTKEVVQVLSLFSAISISSFLSIEPVFADTTVAQPQLFGLKQGRLLACKARSNCISTSSVNSLEKYSRPWEFEKPVEEEFSEILNVLKSDPYLKVADQDASLFYVRAEAKSAVPPTGTDDIELLLNGKDKIITYRSNSRELVTAGTQVIGDAGSNRNRLDSIKRKLGVNDMGMNADAEQFIRKTEQLSIFQQIAAASKPNDINFLDNSVPETQE